jgi:hypothetical protein
VRRGLREKDAGILAAGHGFEVGMSAAAHFEMGVVGDEVEMESVAPRVGATGQFQSAVLDDVDAGCELDVRLWLNCRAAAERLGIDDVVALLKAGPLALGLQLVA